MKEQKEIYNKEKWSKINTIITVEQYKKIKLYAFENNISMRSIIRNALDMYLEQENKK